MAVAGLRRAKKPTKIKTTETHPYLQTMAKHLNASEMQARLLDLRSILDNLTDAGGLVAGVFDPHAGMSFDALIVKRG